MALFTRRDRIAIAVIAGIILAGWGARLLLHHGEENKIRIIRGSLRTPAPPDSTLLPDTVSTSPESPAPLARININRADASELDRLPGIGPSKAAAIIRYRMEHGPFSQPSDIMRVKGIGPGTYDGISTLITVGGHSARPLK